ncbi:hypothetical protein [Companilactobacillus futsaii]|nr:hypothetical protein [Companilactobacillus futsaii]
MKYPTQIQNQTDINYQKYQAHSWITSELLIGMYSRVFTNLLLADNQIFK